MTRTEKTYYAVFGLYGLAWWSVAPMYPLFLLSRGLDLFQANVVLATYLVVVFLFEVPTGAVADVFGRKFSFVLSCFVRGGAYLLYAFAEDFGDCLVAETIDAIGTTLATGAIDAWAVDGMRSEGDHRGAQRFFAKSQMVTRVVMIGGGIASGYAAAVDIRWPWLGGSAVFALAGSAGALFMREPPRISGTPRASLGTAARQGFEIVRRAPVLRLLCALSFALTFAAMPAHMVWQPRIEELAGTDFVLLGWIWVGLNVCAVAGAALLPRILRGFSRERVLAAAILWRGAMIGFAAAATGLGPAIAGWLLQEIGYGMAEPVLQGWLNDHVDADRRATVISVRSACATLGGGLGLLTIGWIARDVSLAAAWGASAVLFVALAPWFLALGRVTGRLEPLAVLPDTVPARITPEI